MWSSMSRDLVPNSELSGDREGILDTPRSSSTVAVHPFSLEGEDSDLQVKLLWHTEARGRAILQL